MDQSFWEGEKINLRAMEPEDWLACFESNRYTEDARKYDRIYFPASKERMKRWCVEQSGMAQLNDEFRWAIEDKQGKYVGSVNTFECSPRYGNFKFAIGILHPYQGNGYAREALKIVLKYYFKELGYVKVTASVYSFNEGSIEMHKKLGFQKEGHLRKMCYTNGEYYDELVFGMTDEEYDQHFS